jgi:hypothetical protein
LKLTRNQHRWTFSPISVINDISLSMILEPEDGVV